MKIAKLRIGNFRSFGPEQAELDLAGGPGYFVVVGPNATGKSNLLEAVRWVTLDKAIGGDFIEPWDFHKGQTESTLKIEAELNPPLKRGDTFNKFSDVALLRLEAKEYKVAQDKGSIRCDHPALTVEGKQIMTSQAIPLAKGRTLTEEEKEGKQAARPLFVRDIKERIPIYYLDNASYGYHLTMGRGSLMSRLARILHDDLIRDDNRIEWRGRTCTRAEAIDDILSDLANLLKTDRASAFLEVMATFLAAQLQIPKDSVALEIGLPRGMDLLRKLDLLGRDSADVPTMPMDRLGRGYSALGIVALFRALNGLDEEHQGSIILIEEPEMFLGPHLRSLFAATLQTFAIHGNQVILVTHSAEFFNPVNPETAILLRKHNGATQCVQWPQVAKTPTFDVTLKFIEPNLNRLIFSKRILFVEGDDDYAAVTAALELLSLTPAYHGLEVLRLGGNGNIVHLVPYAQNFRILHAALLDADAKSILEGVDATGKSWRLMEPDLEGVLNTTKQKHNSVQVAQTVKSFGSWLNLETACPRFTTPLKELLVFLGITI